MTQATHADDGLAPRLTVERHALGPMANFVYLLVPQAADRLVVVDPAWEPAAILARAAELGRTLTDIVLTHHHPDHRNGVEALLEVHPARIHVQRAELPYLSALGWQSALVVHDAGDRVDLGNGAELQLLHTPGHTPGSQCIRAGENLLTGDTLFVDGCGRCDLPGGDPTALFHTLSRTLGQLPGKTRVLPGHDYAPIPEDSLEGQRISNPYLQFRQVEDFVRYRMRPRT